MSDSVQRRIKALEGRESLAMGWVWRHEGETPDDAKKRGGFSPYDDVIVFSWASNRPSIGAAA